MFNCLARLATLSLVLLPVAVSGQPLKPGEPAPELSIERTIPGGAPLTVESLRGKLVIVEFWATWCGYCIEEIPRLNALSEQFPDVQFISVTDERASAVEPFLARHPIRGTVALDRAGATFKAYGVETRPRTVLIGKDGIHLATMHPAQLTAEVMADFAAGRPVTPLPLRRTLPILDDNSVEPLYAVVVRPARKRGSFTLNPSYVQGTGLTLKTLLAYAHSLYETRIEAVSELMGTRYDFCVALPPGESGEPQVLRDALDRAFRMKTHYEKRTVDALVLTSVSPKLKQLKTLGPTVTGLAGSLERRLKQYVVDETGLRGYFYIEQPSEDGELERYIESIGLKLTPARRTIEVLVVDSVELPAFR